MTTTMTTPQWRALTADLVAQVCPWSTATTGC